jgi:hypothetical protein
VFYQPLLAAAGCALCECYQPLAERAMAQKQVFLASLIHTMIFIA